MEKQVIGHAGIPGGMLLAENKRSKFVAVTFHVCRVNVRHFNSVSALLRATDDLLAKEAHPALAA